MNIKPTISHSRHIAKTLTWRVIASLDTLLITWFISGDVKVGLSVASLEVVTKMILYYYHERLWYKIDFGVNNRSNFRKHGKKSKKTYIHGTPAVKRN
mgnify:CR=1 FL=1